MRLVRVMQHGRVELYELHVGYGSLGTIDHGDAVARSNDGVTRSQIDGTATARTHERHLAEVSIHLLRVRIQHVGAIALDVG